MIRRKAQASRLRSVSPSALFPPSHRWVCQVPSPSRSDLGAGSILEVGHPVLPGHKTPAQRRLGSPQGVPAALPLDVKALDSYFGRGGAGGNRTLTQFSPRTCSAHCTPRTPFSRPRLAVPRTVHELQDSIRLARSITRFCARDVTDNLTTFCMPVEVSATGASVTCRRVPSGRRHAVGPSILAATVRRFPSARHRDADERSVRPISGGWGHLRLVPKLTGSRGHSNALCSAESSSRRPDTLAT